MLGIYRYKLSDFLPLVIVKYQIGFQSLLWVLDLLNCKHHIVTFTLFLLIRLYVIWYAVIPEHALLIGIMLQMVILVFTVVEYLCHKWPRICSTCRKHFPVLSWLMVSFTGFVTRLTRRVPSVGQALLIL